MNPLPGDFGKGIDDGQGGDAFVTKLAQLGFRAYVGNFDGKTVSAIDTEYSHPPARNRTMLLTAPPPCGWFACPAGSVALTTVEKQRRIPRPPADLLPINRKRWRLYWESDLAKAADRAVDLPFAAAERAAYTVQHSRLSCVRKGMFLSPHRCWI